MSSRETILLVSGLAAIAALFPAYISYFGKDGVPSAQPSAGAPATPGAQPPVAHAVIPYLLSMSRAVIYLPSKPIAAAASLLTLIAAPAVVVLDVIFYLISFPFVALSALIRAFYPIYVLCGAAVLTGAILGGLVVGFVKFVLLVQEVRRNRAEIEEFNQWKSQSQYYRRRDEYYSTRR